MLTMTDDRYDHYAKLLKTITYANKIGKDGDVFVLTHVVKELMAEVRAQSELLEKLKQKI